MTFKGGSKRAERGHAPPPKAPKNGTKSISGPEEFVTRTEWTELNELNGGTWPRPPI